MFSEGFFVFVHIGINAHCLLHPCLFPKQRDRPSDLNVTEALVSNEEHLLGLAKIGYVSFYVNASCVEPSSSFGPASPSYQYVFQDMS